MVGEVQSVQEAYEMLEAMGDLMSEHITQIEVSQGALAAGVLVLVAFGAALLARRVLCRGKERARPARQRRAGGRGRTGQSNHRFQRTATTEPPAEAEADEGDEEDEDEEEGLVAEEEKFEVLNHRMD